MSIAPLTGIKPVESSPVVEQKPGADLGHSFTKALDDARALDQDATQKADAFAANDQSVGIHEVMIATEKANIALRYATTLKNKALEAYHELMQTNV
ncbi:MAG TPA: flagellar hook-basal body complex protein FliE [Kofleriaceae bacterium]|jgi:flagellar hook-basal body complex protein FliE|nr:flagellar hook-basal body complex protein FliE [Kofleriaceae bacterium]